MYKINYSILLKYKCFTNYQTITGLLFFILFVLYIDLYNRFSSAEHLTAQSQTSNEALHTLSSVYNTGSAIFGNINVTGKITVNGTTIDSTGIKTNSITSNNTTIDTNGINTNAVTSSGPVSGTIVNCNKVKLNDWQIYNSKGGFNFGGFNGGTNGSVLRIDSAGSGQFEIDGTSGLFGAKTIWGNPTYQGFVKPFWRSGFIVDQNWANV